METFESLKVVALEAQRPLLGDPVAAKISASGAPLLIPDLLLPAAVPVVAAALRVAAPLR